MGRAVEDSESLTASQVSGLLLQQRVVRTAENGFRLSECSDFVGPGLFSNIEILKQPIAFAVQCRNNFECCHHFTFLGLQLLLVLRESSFGVSLDALLFTDGLRIGSTLLR